MIPPIQFLPVYPCLFATKRQTMLQLLHTHTHVCVAWKVLLPVMSHLGCVASPRICNAPLRWSSSSSASSRSATDWLARSCRGRVFRIARVLKLWVPGTRYPVITHYSAAGKWLSLWVHKKKIKYTEKLCAICLDVKDIFGICGMWCSAALSTWCQLTYDILLLLLLLLSVLQHLPQVRTDIGTTIEAWQLLCSSSCVICQR